MKRNAKLARRVESSWVEHRADEVVDSVHMRYPLVATFHLARAAVALATIGVLTKMAALGKKGIR